jgi:hypothetical protein
MNKTLAQSAITESITIDALIQMDVTTVVLDGIRNRDLEPGLPTVNGIGM